MSCPSPPTFTPTRAPTIETYKICPNLQCSTSGAQLSFRYSVPDCAYICNSLSKYASYNPSRALCYCHTTCSPILASSEYSILSLNGVSSAIFMEYYALLINLLAMNVDIRMTARQP